MSIQLSNLLPYIHSTKRTSTTVRFFAAPTKIVLLDFIGAPDYFITDFGAIFHRRRIYTNRRGIVSKGYTPEVPLDPYTLFRWSLLDTNSGKMWFPLNQVLGWAFTPQTDRNMRYFLPKHLGVRPLYVDHYEWSNIPPQVPADSKYLLFMQELYKTVQEDYVIICDLCYSATRSIHKSKYAGALRSLSAQLSHKAGHGWMLYDLVNEHNEHKPSQVIRMSKQIAVLDTDNFRYIVSPLKPGNVITLQDVFKAIKNSTQLKWLEIAKFAGLSNANRAFRVAYLQKDREEMKALQAYLVVDAVSNCAYFYRHDHKPAQVIPPHVGPTIVSSEPATKNVVAGVPSLFATRVIVSDPLNRILTMTVTPTGGYIITNTSNIVYDTDVTYTLSGSAAALNKILDNLKFVGRGKGSSQVVIAVDDREGAGSSTASVTVKLNVTEGVQVSVPVLTVPSDGVTGKVKEYTDLKISITDKDNKRLAVRFTPFNCQLFGFRSWAEILGPQETHVVNGVPDYITKDLAKLQVMPLAEKCSVGIEVRCGKHYELKYVNITATSASVPEKEEEQDEPTELSKNEVQQQVPAQQVAPQPTPTPQATKTTTTSTPAKETIPAATTATAPATKSTENKSTKKSKTETKTAQTATPKTEPAATTEEKKA